MGGMYAHAKKSAAGVQYYGSVFHYRVVVAAYNAQGKFLYGRMNTIAIIIQKTTIIHVKTANIVIIAIDSCGCSNIITLIIFIGNSYC